MATWQDLRDGKVIDQIHDDQYAIISHKRCKRNANINLRECLIINLDFAVILSDNNPDIKAILHELVDEREDELT